MQLIKRFNFQLGILIFTCLLYLTALGNNIAITLSVVFLLCAGYIIANKQQHKSAGWIRIILYAVLVYYLYGFFTLLPTEIHVIKLMHPNIDNLKLIRWLYVDYYWELLMIGVLAFVLVFNHKKRIIV